MIDTKFIFAIISTAFLVCGYFPYIRGMLGREVKPHPYTWLIWALTQGTATAGLWYGGGGYSFLSLSLGTLLVLSVFLFSFKFGTPNITLADTALLILALIAFIVWGQMKNPVLAIFMVSAIDFVGYVPSYRKTFAEPWSESVTTWILFTLSGFFALLAVPHYNLLTSPYLLTLIFANIIFIAICLWRRPLIPRPQ